MTLFKCHITNVVLQNEIQQEHHLRPLESFTRIFWILLFAVQSKDSGFMPLILLLLSISPLGLPTRYWQ